jgi:hypothetical protein
MVPTNVHWVFWVLFRLSLIWLYIKISLYTKWTPTCFSQPCGHLHGYKTQRLDILKVQNGIIRVSETIHRWTGSDTFIMSFYIFNISNLCVLHPLRWPHGWPKHVGVHFVYKLILIYSQIRDSWNNTQNTQCTFVCTITVYILTMHGSWITDHMKLQQHLVWVYQTEFQLLIPVVWVLLLADRHIAPLKKVCLETVFNYIKMIYAFICN